MSNTISSQEFEKSLVDVRKAYRLLYLYQKRVMDLMQFIGDSFNLRYTGGQPWFSNNTPRNFSGSLENWAWDWLTMYLYEFIFSAEKLKEKGMTFSVLLQSDTGFYDAESENATELNSFISTESSSTKLVFILSYSNWHIDFKDYIDNNKSPAYKKNFTESVIENKSGALLIKAFPLAEFINADTTRTKLLEFVAFCHKNNIKEINLSN